MRHAFIASMLASMLLAARVFADAGPEPVTVSVRGQAVALMIYRPGTYEPNAKGTIIMGSGDVGWLGVAASMSEFLRSQGVRGRRGLSRAGRRGPPAEETCADQRRKPPVHR